MTALELHRRAMSLADIADQLARKGDHARSARFYGYAARREMAAVKCVTVEPSRTIMLESAWALFENAAEQKEREG